MINEKEDKKDIINIKKENKMNLTINKNWYKRK